MTELEGFFCLILHKVRRSKKEREKIMCLPQYFLCPSQPYWSTSLLSLINSQNKTHPNIAYSLSIILTIRLMTAKIKRRTITQMAKLPFLPRKPVLWSRSSSIGMYPALKLLLCSLLTFLRSTAFSRIDFFTGPLELCYDTKHGLAVARCV